MKLMRRLIPVRRRFLQRTEGMSAVELALVLPTMLLIFCGIMDFGNLYFQMNIVNEAAREAARKAATIKPIPTQTAVQTTIRTQYGNSINLTFSPNPPTAGTAVTATVTKTVPILTPLINVFIPNNPTSVTGKSVMQVEN